MSNHRRFNYLFLTVVLLPMACVGAFNVAVDPYGVLKTPIFTNMTQLKPEQESHDRLFKAVDVARMKPKVIFLGASTTQFGLNPKHELFRPQQQVYNLGLQDVNIYEIKRYFQHALTNQSKLEVVVLGLDLFIFEGLKKNNPGFTEERLNKQTITLEDALAVTFSVNAINSSSRTILANINEKNSANKVMNGMLLFDERKALPGSLQRFTHYTSKILRKNETHNFSQQRLAYLQEIVSTCKQRGIEIKIFISPSHAIQLEAMRAVGNWSQFEQWKREVVKIAPVWDFSGYNTITTERISNNMKNYYDSAHYRKEIGDLILNRMFHYHEETVPDNFGVLISPNNIESHLAKIRVEREAWATKKTEVVKLVQDLKHQAGEKKRKSPEVVIKPQLQSKTSSNH